MQPYRGRTSIFGGIPAAIRIVGSKDDLFSQPAYQVGLKMEHILTVEKATTSESFQKTDHFGGELKYFSDCLLHDEDPEPDGEEGLLDVRVLAAIEQALLTGAVQKLAPFHRSRRPDTAEVETLSPPPEPELVGAHKPSEGG